ncbi:hypothetical protein Tco_1073069 [Tanacetum coccineum]
MVEEVTSLKTDFQQKENKYLKEFLDMKALKEKVEDRLFKQDQSIQTVHMLCKPKSFYDEINRVAIGYKNPSYLFKAKQVQPALYNGYEIVKPNHDRALVHDSKDTLKIAKTTRKQMLDKMNDPECVKKKVKIAPHNYSKENYLAIFTPQKQLTPEQIFWSDDLIKIQAKALKAKAKSANPNKALTVYHPNTPAKLVPKVLPTKSQVQINIYSLVQLFSEFDKTCKKRITPTGLTEGERGFEQKKACYLTEVIPFFKTIKEHFEGIQTALIKEIKEMKEVFDQMEAEVDQHVIDKKFTEMHDAHTVVQARCLELEAELSKLKDKIQNDDHDEMIKCFSHLEVNHLNLQLKYQHLKESFRNKRSLPARDVPDFDSVFEIRKMKASIQGKDNAIKKLKLQISQLKETRSEADQQNELYRTENAKIKQHYKELYDSIKIMRDKHIEQTTALVTENENLKAKINVSLQCVNMESVKPKVLAPGMYAIDVEPIPPRNRNNREVHLGYLTRLKDSVGTLREIVEEARAAQPLDNALEYSCRYTKHS